MLNLHAREVTINSDHVVTLIGEHEFRHFLKSSQYNSNGSIAVTEHNQTSVYKANLGESLRLSTRRKSFYDSSR